MIASVIALQEKASQPSNVSADIQRGVVYLCDVSRVRLTSSLVGKKSPYCKCTSWTEASKLTGYSIATPLAGDGQCLLFFSAKGKVLGVSCLVWRVCNSRSIAAPTLAPVEMIHAVGAASLMHGPASDEDFKSLTMWPQVRVAASMVATTGYLEVQFYFIVVQ